MMAVKHYITFIVLLNAVLLNSFSSAAIVDQPPQENAKESSKTGQAFQHAKVTFQNLPENFEYNGVHCILMDHKGYMWFGTTDGLIRFDGINTYLYEHIPGDTTSLSHNNINSLIEDVEGRLYVGTSSGLFQYNREKDNFINVGRLHHYLMRLTSNYVTSFLIDQRNRLWIGTFGDGINICSADRKTLEHFTYYENDTTSLSSDRVTHIVLNDSDIWVGTQNGLNLYLPETNNFQRIFQGPHSYNLSSNSITSMTTDHDGNLWLGTRGGGLNKLIAYRDGEYWFKHYRESGKAGSLSNDVILSMVEDLEGNLWIGTENGGLNLLPSGSDKFRVFMVNEGDPYSISSNSIWALGCDHENRIWIGFPNSGINVIDEKYNKFESFQRNLLAGVNTLPDNDVRSFALAKDGKIWIATDGGGICQFDPVSRTFQKHIDNQGNRKYLESNAVQALLVDNNNNLWVGMWDGGVTKLDSSGKHLKNYSLATSTRMLGNDILGLSTDLENNIWACTAGGGLQLYNAEKDEFEQILCKEYSNILNSGSYVTTVFQDSKGNYWIGTLYGFLKAHYKNGQFQCEEFVPTPDSGSINSRMIDIVFEDSKGRLWVGSSDFGLNLLDQSTMRFSHFQKQDGLPSNSIRGIMEDDQGYLWIITQRGLSRFGVDSLTFTNFTREDGLNSNELYVRSCLQTPWGEMFIGSERGFNTFYPDKIIQNNNIPPIRFTGFKINNIHAEIDKQNSPLDKQIDETQKISLNHTQSSFTIEFVALNYTRPKKNQFAYKLEGFDESWIDGGNSRSATYTNIKPGKYIFLVKASNNDGVWNSEPRRLQITIHPPFWKEWWAYVFYYLVITLLIILALRISQERIRIKNQLMLEKLAKEKEHEINERNMEFFTHVSHEFRTPLSLIVGPLESMINTASEEFKSQLSIIQRNASRLLHLTNNLMNFRKFEEGGVKLRVQEGDILSCLKEISDYFNIRVKRRALELSIQTNSKSIQGWFDPEKLETILLNLLSNAIKYTPDKGKITIVINSLAPAHVLNKYEAKLNAKHVGYRYLELQVSDQGSGIPLEDLPHIFDKFYQSSGSGNKKKSGTGIGLSLTKGLVEKHRGVIWAESILNEGSSFTVLLPIDRDAYTPEEIAEQPNFAIENDTIMAAVIGMAAENSPIYQTEETTENPEILLVEDNDDLRNFLSRELSKSFTIKQAEDGQLGLDMAQNIVPDLIISDVMMPGLTGMELCRILKSDVRTSHIPVILLTAKTTLHDQIAGAEIGADAYLTKPFSLELLIAKINQLIQTRRKLYKHFSQDVYILPNKLTNNKIDEEFLQHAIRYIEDNITDADLNVVSLANELNLSRSNAYRKIKALTGYSVIEFIRNIRLKQAIKLMEENKFSLAEIAYQTGFTSPSYFTKIFKRKYGKPPSEFLPGN